MERTLHRLGVCLFVVALVTAGCQAPVADASSDGTPLPNESGNETDRRPVPNITVVNGSLELDPGEVFARVQAISGTNVTAPSAVRVFDTSAGFYNSTPRGLEPNLPQFWRVAGLETEPVNGSTLELQKNGYVTATGEVTLFLGPNTTLADERLLLVHEFTHYIQTQSGQLTTLNNALDPTITQSVYVRRAIMEGTAVFTTDTYVDEYAPGQKLNSPWYDEIQSSYPDGHVGQFQNSRYIHGHDYVESRLNSSANISTVYENPPRTSEQVLHGLAPDEEPPTPMVVETTTEDGWLDSGTDQMGEAFLRYALASDVGQERAARAATGWGNDRLHIFRPIDGDETGYIWILDWDDPANASEFEQTFQTALDARGNETEGVWSLADVDTSATITRVDAETTAVVFGPETFVTGTSVTETTVTEVGNAVTINAGSNRE